jgi:hypothetical protein
MKKTEEQNMEAALETVFKLKEMEGEKYFQFRQWLLVELYRRKHGN